MLQHLHINNIKILMSNNYENNNNTNPMVDTINQILRIPGSILSSFLDTSFGRANSKRVAAYRKIADKIVAKRDEFVNMSNEALSQQTQILKQMIHQNASEETITIHAFATAREAARRMLNEEPYLTQIIGGIAIHKGNIAEMKTGEGKTLTGVMPAYLNALYGRGVHIVTVNDYLAKRDAVWMKPVFDLLNITTGYITANMSRNARKDAYHCDITYCTNNEIVFDYLKDNMARSPSEVCHRVDADGYHVLNFALIDEVDSVLIDSKRMPLIISGHADDPSVSDSDEQISNKYVIANNVVKKIKATHSEQKACYIVKKKEYQVLLNELGFAVAEHSLREQGYLNDTDLLYMPQHADMMHKINQALRAHFLYILDREYIVTIDPSEDGHVCQIIDEHTGRTMPGRRYSHGLHQAIEAKEEIEIRPETSVLASATFNNYFCSYQKLAGMTGTAITEAEEFDTTYNLECIQIPSNRPLARRDDDDRVYLTYEVKKREIINHVKECYKRGQPVIIGTTSVESSNELGDAIKYAFQTDASLRRINKPHEALYQLDIIPHIQVLNAVNHAEEAKIVSMAGRLNAVTVVTNMAGRGTDIKLGGDAKFMLQSAINRTEQEDIMHEIEENKKAVIEAGGLMIIGVEHNNNRRIDNQLKGRAGRQGDPGCTVFYVSTQDDIIRSFNPNMTNMLAMMGTDADDVLEHPWLTNAIVDSQKRLEAYHFEERQMTQKYANIREEHIKAFYKNRVHALHNRIHMFVEQTLKYVEIDKIINIASLCDALEIINTIKHSKANLITRIADYIHNISITSIHDASSSLDYSNMHSIVPTMIPWMKSKLLQIIDNAIIEFNDDVEHIRDMTSLQMYVQKDPLIMYYEQCKSLFSRIQHDILFQFITILNKSNADSNESITDATSDNEDKLYDYLSTNPQALQEYLDMMRDILEKAKNNETNDNLSNIINDIEQHQEQIDADYVINNIDADEDIVDIIDTDSHVVNTDVNTQGNSHDNHMHEDHYQHDDAKAINLNNEAQNNEGQGEQHNNTSKSNDEWRKYIQKVEDIWKDEEHDLHVAPTNTSQHNTHPVSPEKNDDTAENK